jgi:hypothetical protein
MESRPTRVEGLLYQQSENKKDDRNRDHHQGDFLRKIFRCPLAEAFGPKGIRGPAWTRWGSDR